MGFPNTGQTRGVFQDWVYKEPFPMRNKSPKHLKGTNLPPDACN